MPGVRRLSGKAYRKRKSILLYDAKPPLHRIFQLNRPERDASW